MVWFFLLFFIWILRHPVRNCMAPAGDGAVRSHQRADFDRAFHVHGRPRAGILGHRPIDPNLRRSHGGSVGIPALRLYALAELLIGISALLVPYQFWSGRQLLERLAVSSSWSYYLGSGICVALTLGSVVCLHGRHHTAGHAGDPEPASAGSERSFSYLYLANVLGAVVGSTVPLLLIELYGFHGTLKVGAICNAALALSAIILSAILPARRMSPSWRRG